jgi:hypothetical protein
MQQWIVLDNGRPFTDSDAAQSAEARLSAQLGTDVQIEMISHASGGYALACRRVEAADRIATPAPGAVSATSPYPEAFRLKPCWRAFSGRLLVGLLAAYVALRPGDYFVWLGMPLSWGDPVEAILLVIVRLAGLIHVVIAVAQIAVAYLSNRYVIDRSALVQIEWVVIGVRLRRLVRRVPFAALTAIEVRQSFLETLLNIGTVRLVACLDDTYQVVLMSDVGSPRKLQAEFELRAGFLPEGPGTRRVFGIERSIARAGSPAAITHRSSSGPRT